MRDVNVDETVDYFERHPEAWPKHSDRLTPLADFLENWRERGVFHLPHGGGRKIALVQEAIDRGAYPRARGLCQDLDVLGMYAVRGPAGVGDVLINSCNFRIDHLDIRTHSQAELEARRLVPVIASFLRAHMPGFEQATVSHSAATVGVRYTRWIDTGFDLTREHLAEGAQFRDVIGVITAWTSHPQGGVIHLPYAAELPLRIMLPQGIANLIVGSGKNVATDGRGLLRGEIPCYVLGQAAGAAAAVAAKGGVDLHGVEIQALQQELLRQNVYLGDAGRLEALGLG
jgi:hypothetical protein